VQEGEKPENSPERDKETVIEALEFWGITNLNVTGEPGMPHNCAVKFHRAGKAQRCLGLAGERGGPKGTFVDKGAHQLEFGVSRHTRGGIYCSKQDRGGVEQN